MKIWNYLLLGHLYLKLSYLQQVNLWKKTFIANSLRQIHQIVNTKHIKTVAYETLFSNFHIFIKWNYERRNLLPKYWGKYTFSMSGSSSCTKKHDLAQRLSWNLDHWLSHTKQSFHLLTIPNYCTTWQMLLCTDLW